MSLVNMQDDGYVSYSSIVVDLFRNPKNVGEVEFPDGVGTATGRIFARITIKIENDKIVDAKFQCSTCIVAVAACSSVTEMIKQMKIAEAISLSPTFIASQLGGIPMEKMDRCHLAVKALRNAILDFCIKSEVARG